MVGGVYSPPLLCHCFPWKSTVDFHKKDGQRIHWENTFPNIRKKEGIKEGEAKQHLVKPPLLESLNQLRLPGPDSIKTHQSSAV